MDLILVRHAIAFERDPLRWPDDSERPLTPAGTATFEQVASGLRQVVKSVDVMLSSPFVRAMQTARILEDVARWPKLEICEVLEPSHDPLEVIAYLREHHPSGVVALVGHEPLMGELAGTLLSGAGGAAQPFKKGGAACFRSIQDTPGGLMMLRWWLPPKVARKLGSA